MLKRQIGTEAAYRGRLSKTGMADSQQEDEKLAYI